MLTFFLIIAAGRFIAEKMAAERLEHRMAARQRSAREFNSRLTSVKFGGEECPKMITPIGTAGGNANRMRTRLATKDLRHRFAQ